MLKLAYPPLAVAVALAMAVAACKTPDLEGPVVSRPSLATPTPTAEVEIPETPGPTAEPVAPGISDEVIKIGVIADASAGNAVTGGSESAWLAMRAWAQAVNSTGGLGGRDVEIVLIDSNVFDHRAAIQEACDSDIFALVGSYALFDGDGVDLLNDESCRLPDFPAAALSPARRESPVTFVSNPTSNDLWQAGAARFLSERYPQSSAVLGTVILDLPVAFYRAQRDIEAASAGGFGFAFQATADVVGEDYDALAFALLESGARGIFWSADSPRLLELLKAWESLMEQVPSLLFGGSEDESAGETEGEEEGEASVAAEEESTPIPEAEVDPDSEELPIEVGDGETAEEDEPTGREFFVLCSTDCYSQSWAEQAGELGSNIWVSIGMLPFEEPGDNVELVRYVLFLREEVDEEAELELIGLSSWASALLFEEAVNRAMFTSGGGLTRELVIEAAGTITEWDGRGLHGPTNPAEGIPSSCFMLVSPTPSGWIRRHPTTQGTLDCDPDNLVELVESATLGIDPNRRNPADTS